MAESALPIEVTENKAAAHILVYFFRKPTTREDSSRLMSEFRKIPNRPNFFPGYTPAYDLMHFDSCWTSWVLSKDAALKDVTIFVPFERDTGAPVAQAASCLREGLLKAFGVSLNRDGWTADCNDCTETDRRMGNILLENSRTARNHLTVNELSSKVSAGRCNFEK